MAENGPAPHCVTCICGRRAPVQGEYALGHRRASGTISWEEHVEAYTGYATRYGTDQSAERLAERGGFGYRELQEFLGHDPKTWVVNGRIDNRFAAPVPHPAATDPSDGGGERG